MNNIPPGVERMLHNDLERHIRRLEKNAFEQGWRACEKAIVEWLALPEKERNKPVNTQKLFDAAFESRNNEATP